jgi:hypothetical protein
MTLEWAFCHSIVGEMPHAISRGLTSKYLSDTHHKGR